MILTDTKANITAGNGAAPIKSTGFGRLPCPKCGDNCEILIDLSDFTEAMCRGCDAILEMGLIRDIVSRWTPVLAWIATAPAIEE